MRAARDYTDLRTANVDRQADWCPDEAPDLAFRGCELAGEVGELCELLVSDTSEGKWRLDVRDELADCFISLDLMAICAGLPLVVPAPLQPEFAALHIGYGGLAGLLGWRVGMVCNIVKKLERERHGWRGSRTNTDVLLTSMRVLAGLLEHLVARMGFRVDEIVAVKFNATSEKVDLPHRLRAS